MKPKQMFILAVMCFFVLLDVHAQLQNNKTYNAVKFNVTGIIAKNYSLQYERIFNKLIAGAVSFRTMPSTTLPFKNTILKNIDTDDPDVINAIKTAKLSNIAITPEVRFYVSRKGYGQGFYVAPFYRYANFKADNVRLYYAEPYDPNVHIDLSGKLNGNTVGILLGSQWNLGKHFLLDWWILGPHYGGSNGNIIGVSDHVLTEPEQELIKQKLDDLDIPFTDKTVYVDENGARVKLNGSWAGIRAGLSFGIKF